MRLSGGPILCGLQTGLRGLHQERLVRRRSVSGAVVANRGKWGEQALLLGCGGLPPSGSPAQPSLATPVPEKDERSCLPLTSTSGTPLKLPL